MIVPLLFTQIAAASIAFSRAASLEAITDLRALQVWRAEQGGQADRAHLVRSGRELSQTRQPRGLGQRTSAGIAERSRGEIQFPQPVQPLAAGEKADGFGVDLLRMEVQPSGIECGVGQEDGQFAGTQGWGQEQEAQPTDRKSVV